MSVEEARALYGQASVVEPWPQEAPEHARDVEDAADAPASAYEVARVIARTTAGRAALREALAAAWVEADYWAQRAAAAEARLAAWETEHDPAGDAPDDNTLSAKG